MKHALTVVLALAASGAAWAHPGHGMPGTSHWHTSDAWGFVGVAAVVAGATLWWHNRK